MSVLSDLPAGTVVNFRTVNSINGTLSAPILGTADGTRVSTDPGLGIDTLSQVIVSLP